MDHRPRYRRYVAAALALAFALAAPGCVEISHEAAGITTAPAVTTAPAAPATPFVTPIPAVTAVPMDTPVLTAAPEYDLTFTTPGNAAVQQYMQLGLCNSYQDAVSLFGQPIAIYGSGGYAYRAIADADDTEAAVVYRFLKDKIGFECIVSALDGRILKKQVSTPAAFPKLLDDAMAKLRQFSDLNAAGYQELLAALGVNPYLWMSFIAPNAPTDADRYDVCLWPDDAGQLVAVVQNNNVLRCEYQPNGIILTATAVDGATPRAPRWLEIKPANDNGALAKYAMFKTFASIKLGASELDVRDKMGIPTSDANGTLTYTYADAAFATGQAQFAFTIAGGKLTAKSVTAMPLGDAEVRGRYAPQMLPGMTKGNIERFMDGALLTSQSLDAAGQTVSAYSYAGAYALISGLFAKGTDACLASEMAVNDAQEELFTLYEEYVLPVIPAAPNSTPDPTRPPVKPRPTPTVNPTRPPIKPRPTPTRPPLSTLPPMITVRPTIHLPPQPTPTFIIPN
ncbi:MAG: hypothetical protein AAGU74_02450 [Bacillota bacterium]